VLGILAVAAGGAALFLRRPLRAWAYSVTGEEDWLPQVKGIGQYASNLARSQPRLQDDVPAEFADVTAEFADVTAEFADVNPFGINTFLEQEVEIAKREKSMQMIHDAGFRWIRQEFPWEDIEIHGKGDFEDRRWEPHRSAWEKYDNIVDLAEQYGIEIIARLDNPPHWTRATNNAHNSKHPPDNYADFGDFVYAVVSRYKGRIRYYQIWNEPNLKDEWGEVNARAYVKLLEIAYTRAQEADPECVILAGALSATIDLDLQIGQGINDFIYLQQMYDAGAAAYFDILSMQGYGLWSGPTDRRMHPRVMRFSRPRYVREIMVANGDAHKPIWISELDWSFPPEGIFPAYGRVKDEDTRARYVVEAYERIEKEWPWMGVACFWFFKRATDLEREQAWYYFRLVEPDFTPLPVYEAIKAHTASN
jgi:hypothetical protein